MRNKIVLFITGCISLMLISCLDSDDYSDTVVIKDAQIKSMTLQHDSISILSDLVFTIDQVGGNIFNKDSLPYGTVVEKVVCEIAYVQSIGVAGIQVTQDVYPDSTYYWNGTDSLDFSKPVKFVTTARDGVTQKTYIAKVNIHTVIPDSMVWGLYATNLIGKRVDAQKVIHTTYQDEEVYFMYTKSSEGVQLYYSPVSDVKKWTEIPLTGFVSSSDMIISQVTVYDGGYLMPSSKGEVYLSPDGIEWGLPVAGFEYPVKSLLGVLPEGRAPLSLTAIVDYLDGLHFARMTSEGWEIGAAVPDNFPVTGFGSLNYTNMHYNYLFLVAGRDGKDRLVNTSWSTMDGLEWVSLTDEKINYFEAKEGVMLCKYDDKFCLVGGLNDKGRGSKEIHFSTDYGVTWHLSDTLVVFPQEFVGRGNASVVVDKDNYMLLFGGKTSSSAKALDEVWRGRINRLGFKD